MHCFYIETLEGDLAALPPEEAKHAAKVLRLKPGDEVCAMDGRGQRWSAVMMEDVKSLRLLELLPDNEPPLRLTVYQGIPKADKLDFIAQKLTELGASALIPVAMDRSVVRFTERDGARRLERPSRIAAEAAKQCRRARPLEVHAPLSLKDAIPQMRAHDLLLIPWEDARGRGVKDLRDEYPDARDIGVVIGPEGGISSQEIELIAGETVTLGPRILRTETAALAAAALVMGLWGDLG